MSSATSLNSRRTLPEFVANQAGIAGKGSTISTCQLPRDQAGIFEPDTKADHAAID
jgi:hypothetical protein